MAINGQSPVKEESLPFMTCILKVNTHSSSWAKTVMKVLKNVNGVSNFRMDEDGTVEVSGTVNPQLLLKMMAKAGKKAQVCWFQFGGCSSNLYMPTPPPLQIPNNYYYYLNHPHNIYYNNSSYYGYGDDDRYLQYDGYGPKRPFSTLYLPAHNLRFPSPASCNASHAETLHKDITSQPPTSSSKGISCCSLM